jgi:hypothetical protein
LRDNNSCPSVSAYSTSINWGSKPLEGISLTYSLRAATGPRMAAGSPVVEPSTGAKVGYAGDEHMVSDRRSYLNEPFVTDMRRAGNFQMSSWICQPSYASAGFQPPKPRGPNCQSGFCRPGLSKKLQRSICTVCDCVVLYFQNQHGTVVESSGAKQRAKQQVASGSDTFKQEAVL